MAEPFLGEIRIMSFNFAAQGLGAVQRAVPADQPEPGAVRAARHDVRRQRPDDLRPARPARPGAAPRRRRASRWARRAARRPTRVTQSEMPTHTHVVQGVDVNADGATPIRTAALVGGSPEHLRRRPRACTTMHPATITQRRRQPGRTRTCSRTWCSTSCIALQGIFPSRN